MLLADAVVMIDSSTTGMLYLKVTGGPKWSIYIRGLSLALRSEINIEDSSEHGKKRIQFTHPVLGTYLHTQLFTYRPMIMCSSVFFLFNRKGSAGKGVPRTGRILPALLLVPLWLIVTLPGTLFLFCSVFCSSHAISSSSFTAIR